MAKAMKNIEEDGGRGQRMVGHVGPSLLDKTYVLSIPAWPVFHSEFRVTEDGRVLFSHYRPLDLFAVLAYHYPPEQNEHTGRRTELLAAVLDSAYLRLTERTAISTEMVLLKEAIRGDLVMRGHIPYQQRFHADRDVTSLRWAKEVWRSYLANEPKATEFLEALLSDDLLEQLRDERSTQDADHRA